MGVRVEFREFIFQNMIIVIFRIAKYFLIVDYHFFICEFTWDVGFTYFALKVLPVKGFRENSILHYPLRLKPGLYAIQMAIFQ